MSRKNVFQFNEPDSFDIRYENGSVSSEKSDGSEDFRSIQKAKLIRMEASHSESSESSGDEDFRIAEMNITKGIMNTTTPKNGKKAPTTPVTELYATSTVAQGTNVFRETSDLQNALTPADFYTNSIQVNESFDSGTIENKRQHRFRSSQTQSKKSDEVLLRSSGEVVRTSNIVSINKLMSEDYSKEE